MAWADDAIATLRVMIDDMVEPYTYDDSKLTSILTLSAKLVQVDVDYDFEYTITMPDTISPDPSADLYFMDLMVLRAACLLDHATNRDMSVKPSVSIKEFQSTGSINYKDAFSARMKIIEVGWCKTYSEALDNYLAATDPIASGGIAIVSPFRLCGQFRIGDYCGR